MKNPEYNKEEIRSKYRDLFRHSLDYIYVNDLKGNFLDANEITLKALGYEKNEISSLSFLDVLDDKEQLITAMEITREIINKGRQQKRSRYKLKGKNGDIIYLETYGIPLKKDDRIYAILGIGRDITLRKLTEHKLKESEKRFRNLFEMNPYGIVIFDLNGKIIDSNPTTENLIGYKKESLIGKHFNEILAIKKKDLPLITKLFNKMAEGIHVHRIDIELKTKNGDFIWTNIQGSVVKFENTSFIQIILHDISKRKEAELLINKQLKKLKELDEMRKNLMVRISHELKTPLMLISGGVEYLFESKESILDQDITEILKTIERASLRLKKLIENLIDATKINYNKLKLDKKKVNFSKIIKDSIVDLKHIINKRNLLIYSNIHDELNLIIDDLRIKQVIANLLLNAIKNTPPEGKITILLEKNDDFVKFSVKDTGIGLTQKEMNILFTQFGKIEREDQNLDFIDIQGSGLGLFISKAIIDLHDGRIWAESKGRNKGAEFIVKLPLNS